MDRRAFLVVDDDPLFLELIADMIEMSFPDVQLSMLDDPVRAGKMCASHAFDCVLIDYQMPVIDGISCARSLSAKFPYLPIILATGAGDEEIATSALHNGVTDYIPKSRLNPDSVRRTIERAIQICAQRKLIDQQRAELENFAHALAHDFKQPLRQIMTFAKMIAAELEGRGNAGIRKHFSYLTKAATRLTALVDVMSEYTLLNRPVACEQIAVSKIVSEAKAALSGYIRERNGAVEWQTDGNFHGNLTLMTNVLQNLIINGLKYNHSDCPTVLISAQYIGNICEISVKDNGIGIDEKYHQTIFSPLIRLHTNTEFEGSGLGLTLTRKALETQHGQISCRSTRLDQGRQGSEFAIHMPVCASDVTLISERLSPASRMSLETAR
ncbi:MAG: response regulator [Sphingobium sp.]